MEILKLVGILSLVLIFSCTSDKTDQFAAKLEFEEYTITNENNISFELLYHSSTHWPSPDYVFSSDEAIFESKIEETSKVLINETMRKQLIMQLADIGGDPCYPYIYHLQFLSNRFSAINITADKKYRDIEAGNSLNSFFILAGLFILEKRGSYSFYEPYRKHINILDEASLNMEDLIFPANFGIGITQPPIFDDRYIFKIEFIEVGGNTFSITLPEINLKTE